MRFHRQSSRATPAKVSEILHEVVASIEPRLRHANLGVAFDTDYRDTNLLTVYKDEIGQVFTNLIGNAIESMITTGGRIRLRVAEKRNSRTGEPGVSISIADTGPGMNPEIKGHLFEPFFTTKQGTGIGLGLWVSSEIVKKHGDSIRIRSSQGKKSGTVATVFLPLKPVGISQVPAA